MSNGGFTAVLHFLIRRSSIKKPYPPGQEGVSVKRAFIISIQGSFQRFENIASVQFSNIPVILHLTYLELSPHTISLSSR